MVPAQSVAVKTGIVVIGAGQAGLSSAYHLKKRGLEGGRGFIVLDHFDRLRDAVAELSGWITAGQLEVLETVVEGFEQLPTAINMLFDGKNVGKLVVHVTDD